MNVKKSTKPIPTAREQPCNILLTSIIKQYSYTLLVIIYYDKHRKFSPMYAMETYNNQNLVKFNDLFLQNLVDNKVSSRNMAINLQGVVFISIILSLCMRGIQTEFMFCLLGCKWNCQCLKIKENKRICCSIFSV